MTALTSQGTEPKWTHHISRTNSWMSGVAVAPSAETVSMPNCNPGLESSGSCVTLLDLCQVSFPQLSQPLLGELDMNQGPLNPPNRLYRAMLLSTPRNLASRFKSFWLSFASTIKLFSQLSVRQHSFFSSCEPSDIRKKKSWYQDEPWRNIVILDVRQSCWTPLIHTACCNCMWLCFHPGINHGRIFPQPEVCTLKNLQWPIDHTVIDLDTSIPYSITMYHPSAQAEDQCCHASLYW